MNPEARPNPTLTGSLPVNAIIEELERHARICKVASQDRTEAALTGETSDKEKNTQQAGEWMLRSAVWIEAATAVRGLALPPDPARPDPAISPSKGATFATNSPPGG